MISLRSEITKKLLNYFFINPHENLYVNEISKKLSLDKRNLVKKIKELEKEGILKSQHRGNLKLYSINKDYPLYNEYRKIVIKTLGFEENIRRILKEIQGIKEAYIYGSYAKNKMDVHSDIDLLVIGDHGIVPLQKKINKIQKEINREINITNMDEQDFKNRIKSRDAFIFEVLKKKYQGNLVNFEDASFVRFEFSKNQIKKHFDNALKDFDIAQRDTILNVKFNYVYTALIKAGIALLSFHQVKVRSVPGHHVKIIEKMAEILDDETIGDMGNIMRSKRNIDLYGGGIEVTEKECTEYIKFAEAVLEKIKAIIKT